MVFIHLVQWIHRNFSFSKMGLFFICFHINFFGIIFLFLVNFGRRSRKGDLLFEISQVLRLLSRISIAFSDIFLLILRYSTGFCSIQHLFLKIQVILPRIRGGKVQANHKKQHFLCVKVVIFGAQKMAQIAHFHP